MLVSGGCGADSAGTDPFLTVLFVKRQMLNPSEGYCYAEQSDNHNATSIDLLCPHHPALRRINPDPRRSDLKP